MSATDYPDLFVAPDWLREHLGDKSVKIVDGSWHMPAAGRIAAQEYREDHIPGAVYFDIDAVADTSLPLPHMLPEPEDFARAVGDVGIREDDTIIVYDTVGLFSAARVWWTFDIMGAEDVKILAGGLPAWKAAGGETTGRIEKPAKETFSPVFNKRKVLDLADMMHEVNAGEALILDARPEGRFKGTAPEPREGLPSGHMPGAVNLPASDIVKDGALIDPDRLTIMLAAAGVAGSRPVITTCGSGVTAALLSLALAATGHENHALYDGSWTEWAGRSDTDIVGDTD